MKDRRNCPGGSDSDGGSWPKMLDCCFAPDKLFEVQARDSALVLVTGATGFVGAELVRTLCAKGLPAHRLRCLVRSRARAIAGGIPPASIVEGDVTDRAGLASAVAGVDLVYHLAGTLKAARPSGYLAVNAEATRELVAAVQSGAPKAHVVLVSSLAAAGPSVDGASSNARPEQCRPVSAYGESKRLGELAVAESDVSWTILRPPVVYGPGDAATRLLFRQACAPVCAVPPVARPLSVIHVRDVVAAVLAAGHLRPPGAVLALDGPDRTDTHQLLRAIAKSSGRTARLLPVPLAVASAAAAVCDAWARITGKASFFNGDKVKELRALGWVADGRAAQHALGIAPLVGMERGLAEVAQREGFARHAP